MPSHFWCHFFQSIFDPKFGAANDNADFTVLTSLRTPKRVRNAEHMDLTKKNLSSSSNGAGKESVWAIEN